MRFSRKAILLGLTGSVFLHASFVLAVVAISKFGIRSIMGTGHVFMVSIESEPHSSVGDSFGYFAAGSRMATSLSSNIKSHPLPRIQRMTSGQVSKDTHGAPSETSTTSGGVGRVVPGTSDGLFAVLSSPEPPYPLAARQAGFEGRVLLDVGIDPVGVPHSVKVVDSSGREDCDESARSTILNSWKFAPVAVTSGVRQQIAVRFKLR